MCCISRQICKIVKHLYQKICLLLFYNPIDFCIIQINGNYKINHKFDFEHIHRIKKMM